MVHRHSLTFRHSQGEAHITSHETRNEQANEAACLGLGQFLTGVGVHSDRGAYYDGSAATLGVAPNRKAPGLQGPLTSLIQDATLGLPRAQALKKHSTQAGEGPGIPSRIQEV